MVSEANDLAKLAFFSGFLGAGKTTVIATLAKALMAVGERVAVITNDQGSSLVDTKFLRAMGIAAAEVPGGCFCCKFTNLELTLNQVIEEVQPTFVFAEAVGSCTDLVATVHRPMNSLHGRSIELLPLTMVVDVECANDWLEFDRAPFPWEMGYLFAKQVEEADIVLVNQIDRVSTNVLDSALQKLRHHNISAHFLPSSALTGKGLDDWLKMVIGRSARTPNESGRKDSVRSGGRPLQEIDYDVYAAAESRLGWLNASLTFESGKVGIDFLKQLANVLQRKLLGQQIEVAHAKVMMQVAGSVYKGALTSTRKSWVWEEPLQIGRSTERQEESFVDATPPLVTPTEESALTRGQSRSDDAWPSGLPTITVNARVLASPSQLEEIFRNAVDEVGREQGQTVQYASLDCFSPGYPKPIYRMA